ncbi:MAG: hypothetical protein IJ453_01790 [Oscillospiraceae bacterium]|nr:hypothetical protein [Oscillospiraceae bacterium]
MNLTAGLHGLRLKVNTAMAYPVGSMALALLLIFLSPFVSSYLCYGALLILVYRAVRYSSGIFTADYCILLPLFHLFRAPGGMSLQVYLCLFAAVWYLIRGSVRADSAVVWFLLLMNYLLARMQLDIPKFLLCFGQLFLFFVILPRQNGESALRAAKLFCISVVLSSLYALALRNTWQLQSVIGAESVAVWGTDITRFRGLFEDPNYYMTMLVVVLGLLLKLRDCRHISLLSFWLLAAPSAVFGVLTYSKTFLLVTVLMAGCYILWQFGSRKLIWGCVLTALAVAGLSFLLLWEGSPLAVVLTRLNSAGSLDELTTGRTAVYADYLEIIFHDPLSLLFGQGLAADGLVKDPHNLYIEILYYVGAVGLVLYVGFYIAAARSMLRNAPENGDRSFFGKYIVLLLVLVLFFALHGMFQLITMGNFLMAFLAMLITKSPEAAASAAGEKGASHVE